MLSDIIVCCEKQFNSGEASAWKHSDFLTEPRNTQNTDTYVSPATKPGICFLTKKQTIGAILISCL
jgi:hypothetical protein